MGIGWLQYLMGYRVIIDFPLTMICRSEIEINPLAEVIADNPEQSNQFCLSLFILLLPYGYLLYQYIISLSIIHRKNIHQELDKLDLSIVAISMLRLGMLFLFPIINHGTGMVILSVLAFLWELLLLFIFISFIVDHPAIWKYLCAGLTASYLLYWIVSNYFFKQQPMQEGTVMVPLLMPMVIITLGITGISGHQLMVIHKSLNENILTPTISIELKHRRSFIFLMLVSCWLSLIMRRYPDIFKPLEGVVLYYIVSEWLSMAIIFRCVLDRIVRSNDDQDEVEEGWGTRNSGLIVVEMQNYDNK